MQAISEQDLEAALMSELEAVQVRDRHQADETVYVDIWAERIIWLAIGILGGGFFMWVNVVTQPTFNWIALGPGTIFFHYVKTDAIAEIDRLPSLYRRGLRNVDQYEQI